MDVIKSKNMNKSHTNILFVGPIGSGKSTMISSMANYFQNSTFDQALRRKEPVIMTPSMCKVKDKSGEEFLVTSGDMSFKDIRRKGTSMTREIKTYTFPIWDNTHWIRAVDTPGMGDFRENEDEKILTDNILSYISQFSELNAICIVLKPLETSVPNEIIKFILSLIFYLGPNVTNNIIWCFTSTRKCFYSIGHSLTFIEESIAKIRNEVPYINLHCANNVFCFENEPFVHLLAHYNLIQLDERVKEINTQSWCVSKDQAYRFINYITGTCYSPDLNIIPMYPPKNKIENINSMRYLITMMSQPITDIAQFLSYSISILTEHRKLINQSTGTRLRLLCENVPIIHPLINHLDLPASVCVNCHKKTKVESTNIFTLPFFCEYPCIINRAKNLLVGDESLLNCKSMDDITEKCMMCNCSYLEHMQIYYHMEYRKENLDLVKDMGLRPSDHLSPQQKETAIDAIEDRLTELKDDCHTISLIAADLMLFKRLTDIHKTKDSIEGYIKYIINREDTMIKNKKSLVAMVLRRMIVTYQKRQYEYEAAILEQKKDRYERCILMLHQLEFTLDTLWNMNTVGKALSEMYSAQKIPRDREFRYSEAYKQKSCSSTKWLQRDEIECLFSNYPVESNDYFASWKSGPLAYKPKNEFFAEDAKMFIPNLTEQTDYNEIVDKMTTQNVGSFGFFNMSPDYYHFGPSFYPPPASVLRELLLHKSNRRRETAAIEYS